MELAFELLNLEGENQLKRDILLVTDLVEEGKGAVTEAQDQAFSAYADKRVQDEILSRGKTQDYVDKLFEYVHAFNREDALTLPFKKGDLTFMQVYPPKSDQDGDFLKHRELNEKEIVKAFGSRGSRKS